MKKDECIKRKDLPYDFWNYQINPITGYVVNSSGSRRISESDINNRRYSVVKRGDT